MNRIYKINQLLKSEVGEILKRENPAADRGVLTVTAVETTADMRQATVWLSYFGSNEEEVFAAVKERERGIQRSINQRLSMKYVPKITFRSDHSGEYADKMFSLIKEIKKTQPKKTTDHKE